MDDRDAINIMFFLDEECIYTKYLDSFPYLREGDIVWLAISKIPNTIFAHATPLQLTKYRILGVEYRFDRMYQERDILDILGLEVRIEEVKDDKNYIPRKPRD